MLNFLGRGAAFTDNHNCAFFIDDSDFVMLDCPMSATQKIMKFNESGFFNTNIINHFYILVTHTHSDHVGGIGMLVHYMYYVLNIPITIIAANEALESDIKTLLKLDACHIDSFNIVPAKDLNKKWFIREIPTTHSAGLAEKCFGFQLYIDNKNIIYTGDTNTLKPFDSYLIQDTILYTETAFYPSEAHLILNKHLNELIEYTANDIKVYLMHLDNLSGIIDLIRHTNIKIVPLYNEFNDVIKETLNE